MQSECDVPGRICKCEMNAFLTTGNRHETREQASELTFLLQYALYMCKRPTAALVKNRTSTTCIKSLTFDAAFDAAFELSF